jgi:REP element-mobilizing transposase RayT
MPKKEGKNSTLPVRQTGNLRRGRLSISHARYFVTLNTKNRVPGLSEPHLIEHIRQLLREMHQVRDIELHCATIMPDHLHLLFTIGTRLSLSQVVRKLKSLSKSQLEIENLKWQANFFEHRLRPDTPMESFAKYIYLNPYRKLLIPLDATWHGWILNRNYQPEFWEHLLEGAYPPKEWLGDAFSASELIKDAIRQEENP